MLLTTVPPAAAETGNEFYAECSDPSTRDSSYCVGYVYGAAEGWSEAMRLIHEADPHVIQTGLLALCTPDGVTLRQALDIVVAYLRDHPEKRDWNMALLAQIATSEAWPCQD